MKNSEVIALHNTIKGMNDRQDLSPQFAYALVRNRKTIDPIHEALVEASKSAEDYGVYERKRIALCRDMAQKDDNDQPRIQGGNFIIPPEDQAEFDRKLVSLQAECKDAIDGHAKLQQEVKELMEQEAEDVKLILMLLSDFPPNVTPSQMEALLPMVGTAAV